MDIDLKQYLEEAKGTGVLATADGEGNVDTAIYARPHVRDDGSLAMIMRERISHKNLKSNPKACYMFIENGPGHRGYRIYLEMIGEETNSDMIEQLRRRHPESVSKKDDTNKFLVFFDIKSIRPLVGA